MDTVKILMIIAIVAVVGWELAMFLLKRYYLNRLMNDMLKGQFDDFDSLVDSFLVKNSVPPFNREYMKLNRFELAGNSKKAEEMYNLLKTRRLNDAQKAEVYSKAFNFFLSKQNKDETRFYLEEVKKLANIDDETKKVYQRGYDVLIEKKTDLLDELLQETEEMEEMMRGTNEYLISEIYRNLGKGNMAKKYMDLSKQHIEMLTKKSIENMKRN